MSFENLGIDPRCVKVLQGQKITEPTPVQAGAIPPGLEGRDVIAIAQTGTGKTLGFGLSTMTRLAQGKPGRNRMLILTPTRELAHQINDVLEPHCRALKLYTMCLYGGVSIDRQAQGLRRGCDIIVATPGRLLDHMNRGNIRFDKLETLVLDEADRMLDMGFMPDIKRIMSELPEEKQTMLFSATFAPEIAKLTEQFLDEPVRIEIGATFKPADAVRQEVYTVHGDQKQELLIQILETVEVGPTLVFLRTKYRTDRLAKALSKHGFKCQAIHGGRTQRQRQQALDGFKRGRYNILIATDVAARGIDVHGITHVVNFDIPNSPDDYIHRIGRTARANAKGDAYTFVSPEDHLQLGVIERALGRRIERTEWDGSVHVPCRFEDNRMPKGRPSGGGGYGKGRPQRNGGGGNRNFRGGAPRSHEERGPRREGGGPRGPRNGAMNHSEGRPAKSGGPRREFAGAGAGNSSRSEGPARSGGGRPQRGPRREGGAGGGRNRRPNRRD